LQIPSSELGTKISEKLFFGITLKTRTKILFPKVKNFCNSKLTRMTVRKRLFGKVRVNIFYFVLSPFFSVQTNKREVSSNSNLLRLRARDQIQPAVRAGQPDGGDFRVLSTPSSNFPAQTFLNTNFFRLSISLDESEAVIKFSIVKI